MMTSETLLSVADAYRDLVEIEKETTLSYRVFGDTKKLGGLRAGADITVSRFNLAMAWFAENWPDGARWPEALEEFRSNFDKTEDAA